MPVWKGDCMCIEREFMYVHIFNDIFTIWLILVHEVKIKDDKLNNII